MNINHTYPTLNYTNINKSPKFTARCPEVRDAQWVCHAINEYPHISTSKMRKKLLNLSINKGLLAEDQGLHYLRFLNRKYPICEKFLSLYRFYLRLSAHFHSVRHYWNDGFRTDLRRVSNVINQFRHDKLGNCGEDAYVAAAIVRINGVENVYTASLTRKKRKVKIDHSFCIFNKDGSEFNKKDISKAIIIDPWIGKADFATNILNEYKHRYGKLLNIYPDSTLRFRKIKKMELSEPETLLLSLKFDKLRYPYGEREFMKRKCENLT